MHTMDVNIPVDGIRLNGNLDIPEHAKGLVIFAHGSGSSRLSPRNQFVARLLQENGLATLLFDLLTAREEQEEYFTRHHRFDIELLSHRLLTAARWSNQLEPTSHLQAGFFGSSTGAAAALVAAAELGREVGAVVSRGGRPDLAGDALSRVSAATLLIVGGDDTPVIALNEQAFVRLQCEKAMKIIPGATHLFEEPGALDQVAQLAADWFAAHLHTVAA